jgi:hypothetical protein
MAQDRRPAKLTLRMAPQLRDGLRAAAAEAGCSLNAFATQVLAAAAGDPARYRAAHTAPAGDVLVRDEERDHRGFPLAGRARHLHIAARSAFADHLLRRMSHEEMRGVVTKYDAEDPAHFVEWYSRHREEQPRTEEEIG